MKIINRSELPADFFNFRSASPTYRAYCESLGLRTIATGEQFGWIKQLVPGKIQVVKFEKVDAETDMDTIRAAGFAHGMIIWIPWRRTEFPAGWRRLLIPTHFTVSGIAVLDNEEYWKEWNERGRRSRKKFFAHADLEIRVPSVEEFAQAYKETKAKFWFKNVFVDHYKKLNVLGPGTIRSWICYRGGEPLAGLAVLDYGNASVHLVSFIRDAGKPLQAGTGLIDRWFSDSRARGMHYLDFDHFQESWLQRDQRGYTDFKKNFINYSFTIRESYFKIL